MRTALLNEGTYPFQSGGVSTWCQQLVTGLDRHVFHLVTLTGTANRHGSAYPLPANVATVSSVAVWDRPVPVPGLLARCRHRRAATAAATSLCRGLLGSGPSAAVDFRSGLRALADLAAGGCHPLHQIPLADVLLDAWQEARSAGGPRGDGPGGGPTGRPHGAPGGAPAGPDGSTGDRVSTAQARIDGWAPIPWPAIGWPDAGAATAGLAPPAEEFEPPLPRLSLRDAQSAAVLLEHALRPLAAQVPEVDITHPVAAGLPLLIALAAWWRRGIPYLLTEHGIYLRERYLEYGDGMPVAVKAVMLRFYRALARLGYREAGLIASVSRFNQRWELRNGAHPGKVLVVPNGVDPRRYPTIAAEPDAPTLVWVGRIDPLKDLHTLIRAFEVVRRSVPTARLRLVGPVPSTDEGYADSCYDLVGRLGLSGVVDFPGPVRHSRDAYATGHVVVLSSISEGMPYTVIEAMMCGRATVSTDVGGIAETVGEAGVVVPPGDPDALAAACVQLLRDDEQRRDLGRAARERAVGRFTTDRMINVYDHLYEDVRALGGPPGSGRIRRASAIRLAGAAWPQLPGQPRDSSRRQAAVSGQPRSAPLEVVQ